MAIYVNFEKPDTLREFLKKLFSHKLPYAIGVSTVKTYQDKECKRLQCHAGKNRSFDDILECVQTYFPEVDEKELLKTLLNLDIKDTSKTKCNLQLMCCADIERITLIYDDTVYDREYWDDIGYTNQYHSKWSWMELLNMIGINKLKELKELSRKKI